MFSVQDVNISRCPICARSIIEVICLPCRHWYACNTCTREYIALAARENAQLRCRVCAHVIVLFQTKHVSITTAETLTKVINLYNKHIYNTILLIIFIFYRSGDLNCSSALWIKQGDAL